ncbi:hypothetical protein Tco_0991557 [Tanacetum coccineum]|uniref:Uncharacterized protein n=1 Tax=Tanacetum coccineum TaxID=301880 RepID=A0ABQ5EZL4_9ASTR
MWYTINLNNGSNRSNESVLLRVTGLSDLPRDLPVWFVETKRYMDFTNPGSQAKQGSFFGLDAALEGLEPSPLLNHLGLANYQCC